MKRSSILLTLALVSTVMVTVLASPGGAVIDTSNRAAVVNAWNNVFEPQFAVPNQWTGNAATCTAGSNSVAFQQATLNTINYFREMAGLPTVTMDPALDAQAMTAALMMQANNALSHEPPPSWNCYTAAGANAAATSNLASNTTGPASIRSYIADTGQPDVGHRRWVLCPTLTSVGSGSTSQFNALKVIGPGQHGAAPTTPQWVSWPPPGFVPKDITFPLWSLSYNNVAGNADFSAATVTMTRNGVNVPVTQQVGAVGFCNNTLTWTPQGQTFGTGMADRTFQVTVSNILVNGTPTTHSYAVTVIDPDAPPEGICLPNMFGCTIPVGGPPGTVTGNNTGFDLEPGEPSGSCWGTDPAHATAWYHWTAPGSGTVAVDTFGSAMTDTQLAVYTGAGVGALTEVACNEDTSPAEFRASLGFTAVAGTTYRIQVDGWGNQQGAFVLNVTGALTTATCDGKNVTVDLGQGQVPTTGPDVIAGTPGADVINAIGGNDTICGLGGGDTINGGPGNDTVLGGDGDDTVFGSTGNDVLRGEGGTDTVQGNAGDDTIDGQGGADTVYGVTGADVLNGGPGVDVVLGGPGNDTIQGNDGNDLLSGNADLDSVDGGPGNDEVYGADGNDTLVGGTGTDVILAGGGDDSVNSQDGVADQVSGNAGADTCTRDAGIDAVFQCETVIP